MSRDTRQNVLNIIDHLFPDNATGEITPQDAREIVKKIINTAVCYEDSSFPNDRDQKPSFPVRYSDDNDVVTFTHATKVTGSGVRSHNGDMLHFHVPDEVDGMTFTVIDDGTGDLVLKAGAKNIASVNIPLGQAAPVDSNQIIDTIGAWLSSDSVTGLNASFNSTTNTLTITSTSNSPEHVVYVDHGFTGISDGSRQAPHKNLNDAVSDLITNGHAAVEVEGIGDVQGVVDFSGLNHDIHIIADFSAVVGTWIFESSFSHSVYVRCSDFSATPNIDGVVKFIATHNQGVEDFVSRLEDAKTGIGVIADVGKDTTDPTNKVKVAFANAPSSQAYKLIIKFAH